MSKKKIYIILAIIFTLFTALLVSIFVYKANNNNNSSEPDLSSKNWAVNEVQDKEETSTTEETLTRVVNNVIYTNLDRLTPAQQADKNGLYDLVTSNVDYEKAEHGYVVSVDVLDKSDEYFTYVTVTFQDNETEDYILVYDSETMHSYLNCHTVERWEYLHSDANKG